MLLPHELSPMSVPFARRTSQVIYRRKQAGPGTLIEVLAAELGVKRQNAAGIHPIMLDVGCLAYVSDGPVMRTGSTIIHFVRSTRFPNPLIRMRAAIRSQSRAGRNNSIRSQSQYR